jgi:hypothetical protein
MGQLQSNTLTVGVPTPSPPPPTASAISVGWSSTHPTWITMTVTGFAPGSYTYTCHFASGGDTSYTVGISASPQTFDNGHTCYDGIPSDQVWVSIGSVTSNHIAVGSPPPPPPPPATTWNETVGAVTHTWTNPSNAGGNQGPSIQSFQTVAVSCRLQGFAVADGNTWWYRIASSPWGNGYYASADPFYNNGATGGPLHGTPLVDTNVAIC